MEIREQDKRTARLIGDEAVNKLRRSCVAVFGLGGVGGFATEALARAGIGTLMLVDCDTVSESNINRQIIALHSTVGQAKAELMAARARDIDPGARIMPFVLRYGEDTAEQIPLEQCDYIVDAIDSVSAKLLLAENAKRLSKPIISCMGTGNKLDASAFRITDITQTSVCPLARVMRRELRKRGIEHLRVLYSQEIPAKPENDPRVPASISFVPSVAGLMLAGEVIKELVGLKNSISDKKTNKTKRMTNILDIM